MENMKDTERPIRNFNTVYKAEYRERILETIFKR